MKSKKRPGTFIRYLPMYGCISTGLVYAAVGVVAILSFLQIKHGGADETSLLVYMDRYLAGRIFIWAVLLGMVSYIVWRVYETIRDPYGYGRDFTGIVQRTVTALSSFADAMIAYSAIQALWGQQKVPVNGMPTAQRQMVQSAFDENLHWLILASGVIACIVALLQVGYVISQTYMERVKRKRLQPISRTLLHVSAWAGHFARGIIIGIIGFFFAKAAATDDATQVVNTDKAFDFIGDDVGHLWFIAVAVGTIAYGVFMFLFGWYYDTDKP